jgi:AraC-like DNA-binding protein
MSGAGPSHRVLPDGCIDVLVFGTGRDARARVVGTMKRAFVVPAQASSSAAIGIRFRPGEAARLLPSASRELTDGEAPLDVLWGDDGLVLEAALVALLDTAVRARLEADEVLARASSTIETTLRKRLGSHGEAVDVRVRAAAEMLASGSVNASVRDAASHVELSERQLTRRFVDRVGVAPKMFARVMRLQRAAALLARGRAPSEAASLAGYADQAHFTRDSSDLAGITPRGLARELSDSFKTDLAVAS